LRFLNTCKTGKGICQEKDENVNSIESSDESPQQLNVIAEFQEQQKERDEQESRKGSRLQ
jgi:hypothetical protein